MNQYVTGGTVKELREKIGLTQAELAETLNVSDKTISKWETGRGYPDISLLEPLAEALHVSVAELLSGNTVTNVNVSANMLRSKFYVCPVCGNVIHSVGETVIHCHGVQLKPEKPEPADCEHMAFLQKTDGEYYLTCDHPMTKTHYISFAAAVSPDTLQLVKLYPEGPAEARFRMNGVKRVYYFCNRDGLFCIEPRKGIDDREAAYDSYRERKELEDTAKRILG